MNHNDFDVLWKILEARDKVVHQLYQQLEQKEIVIQQMQRVIQQNENVIQQNENVIQQNESIIQQKESIIKEQSRALFCYRQAYFLLSPLLPLLRLIRHMFGYCISISRPRLKSCVTIFRPRLGNLNQYSPRPLLNVYTPIRINQLVNTPKISIVTPSFQQGGFIERTIKSVLSQQYPNLEYYVQDGGSKDDTVSVLKRYENKLSGWKSIKDNGQSQAINLGFANTTGEIMAWLNSDDLLLPGSLALVIDFFNKHPEVDVVYGNRLLIDEDDKEIGRWIMPGHDSDVLTWVDYVPQETLFWRRSIWNKAGGKIDETFRFAMDWDLLVRFREVGAKFAHVPYFLGAFRIHQHQKTSASISAIGYQEMDRIRERLLGKVPTREEIRKKVTPFMLKHIYFDLFYRIKTRLGYRC